jgi:hypothetical protein
VTADRGAEQFSPIFVPHKLSKISSISAINASHLMTKNKFGLKVN